MEVLDLRGLPCPKPFETFMKKAYIFEGGEMKVIVDNPICFQMIVQIAPYMGCEVLGTKKDEETYEIFVRKGAKKEEVKEEARSGC